MALSPLLTERNIFLTLAACLKNIIAFLDASGIMESKGTLHVTTDRNMIQLPLKIGPKHRSAAPEAETPAEILGVIFHHKKDFYLQQENRLTLNLAVREPWRPEPVSLLSSVLPEWSGTETPLPEGEAKVLPSLITLMRKVIDRFHTGGAEIVYPGAAARSEGEIAVRRKPLFQKGQSIPLDIFEFVILAQAAVEGTSLRAGLVSFIHNEGYDRAPVTGTYLIPADTPVGKLTEKVLGPDAPEGEQDEHIIINPLSGMEFSSEDPIDYRSRLLYSGSKPFRLRLVGRISASGLGKRTYTLDPYPADIRPCINCLACARICPSRLYPSLIYHHIKAENRAVTSELNIEGCISCGICSAVCPSSIPLAAEIIPARQEVVRIYADTE